MGLFDKKTGGFMDEIRCDEQEYLIWKWHPAMRRRDTTTEKTQFAGALRYAFAKDR